MRTMTTATWAKVVLASAAALVIGGPGLVLASDGCTTYQTPISAQILGAGTVSGSAPYQLRVTFQDSSTATYGSPDATFSTGAATGTASGSFSGATLTASGTGNLVLRGTYSNSSGSVTATRRVRIQ